MSNKFYESFGGQAFSFAYIPRADKRNVLEAGRETITCWQGGLGVVHIICDLITNGDNAARG